MKQLTDQVKPFRNHLAHNGSVRHKDLALLRVHFIHELTHQNTIDEFRYEAAMTGVQRELIQKFIVQTRAYIIASEQVLTMIYLYLAKPFLDNVGILVEEHYNKKPIV